jgi:hypothetical protein
VVKPLPSLAATAALLTLEPLKPPDRVLAKPSRHQ